MTRPWTMREMTGEVAGLLGMVPASAEGDGLAFLRGDLRSVLSVWKDRYDKTVFGWMVITYDTALRDQMKGFGGMGIRIDHPPPSGDANPTDVPPAACYPWPASGRPLAAEVSTAVTRYGPPSLGFVRDRRDLGLLLLTDGHVHRGGV